MSAAGRGRRRGGEHDDYSTPAWCVHRLLDYAGLRRSPCASWSTSGRWLEPAAGEGAIIRAVNEWHRRKVLRAPAWTAIEIRTVAVNELRSIDGLDVRAMSFFEAPAVAGTQVVITNPPYLLAQRFVEHAHALYPGAALAFLLRLNFAASEGRVGFFRAHPPTVLVIPNRPSFTGDGRSDATEYAWFLWGWGDSGRFAVLDSTPVEERRFLAPEA